jgi:predicted metal-dependent hydrolase
MYQGILQVGVAYYQVQRKNYVGARKLFQRAWQYLTVLPDWCQGVDIARLRADAQVALAELERLGPERIAEFDPAFFKPVMVRERGTGSRATASP